MWKLPCTLVLLAVASPAQTYIPLLVFDGANGGKPGGSLVQGADGNFYGATNAGGANNNCYLGCGTVFKISAQGALTTLYNFAGTDGQYPAGGLTLATDGKFYGTTSEGGANNWGTVFQMTPGGTLTILHNFDNADGFSPEYALVQVHNGHLYGSTSGGGPSKFGVIFEMSTGGAFTALHAFDCQDGDGPALGGLIQAFNGNLYGASFHCGFNDHGSIYDITPQGTFTAVHSFAGGPSGIFPVGIMQAADGNFYGMTNGGTAGYGTIFKMTPTGTATTLHRFNGSDGIGPSSPLIQATDGNFYGSTNQGGANNMGTLFRMMPSGTVTTLYNFTANDAYGVGGALLQATDGNFYGVTSAGGLNDNGGVFKLSTGLGAFVKTIPTSGLVGAPVTILGTDLSGAKSVSFNGTATTFTVLSPTSIATTVPANATTGKVRVTLPAGSLSSNVVFRVTP